MSESEQKHKTLNFTNNNTLVDALVEESNASTEAEKEQNEEAFQPKKVDMRKWEDIFFMHGHLSTNLEYEFEFINIFITSSDTNVTTTSTILRMFKSDIHPDPEPQNLPV